MSIVTAEDRGAVRHVVLNRPEKRNAMSQELLRALAHALREAAAEESVHCVVLRGEGQVFSAGVDLVELAASAATPGQAAPLPRDLPGVRQPLRRDGQAGDLPDPPTPASAAPWRSRSAATCGSPPTTPSSAYPR